MKPAARKVSDAFAFMLAHGDLTDRLILDESFATWLSTEERSAVEFAYDHLYDSWVGLLETCRAALLASTVGSELDALMTASKRQSATIWKYGYVDCPLLPKWDLWFSAELDLVDGAYHLVWSIGAKEKYGLHLHDCSQPNMKIVQRGRRTLLSYDAGTPVEGESFEVIADRCLSEVQPVLVEILVTCRRTEASDP